jgi:transposase
MTEITTVGLNLAKRVVSLCGGDAAGRVVVQRTLRREAVLGWFVQWPPCVAGIEACSSAHLANLAAAPRGRSTNDGAARGS